jgi:hypothetical protein
MADDSGNLSIDFLVAFTIFMIAFIWVATMIPGLLIGLSAHGIDYDAVAYRTAVILVEDPGATIPSIYTPWEQEIAAGKDNIERFGLAISKDTPNILSRKKIERFFSTDFVYPDDYRKKVIFGDYPYRFNISLKEEGQSVQYVGEPLWESNYGFIRREVKIKGSSNATINTADYTKFQLFNKDTGIPKDSLSINVTKHDFAIQINRTRLLHGDITEPPLNPSYNAAYQIDPRRDWIIINITDTDTKPAVAAWTTDSTYAGLDPVPVNSITLTKVRLSQTVEETKAPDDMGGYDMDFLYIVTGNSPLLIDGKLPATSLPQEIYGKNITLKFKPGFFGGDIKDNTGSIYINMTFVVDVDCTHCTLLGTEPLTPHGMPYLNTSESGPWNYNYNVTEVTQTELTNGVLEVAVW